MFQADLGPSSPKKRPSVGTFKHSKGTFIGMLVGSQAATPLLSTQQRIENLIGQVANLKDRGVAGSPYGSPVAFQPGAGLRPWPSAWPQIIRCVRG